MKYLCSEINSFGRCTQWVEYVEPSNFITEMSQLSYAQAGQLLSLTALLFASAWLWKHLSLTARKG